MAHRPGRTLYDFTHPSFAGHPDARLDLPLARRAPRPAIARAAQRKPLELSGAAEIDAAGSSEPIQLQPRQHS